MYGAYVGIEILVLVDIEVSTMRGLGLVSVCSHVRAMGSGDGNEQIRVLGGCRQNRGCWGFRQEVSAGVGIGQQ